VNNTVVCYFEPIQGLRFSNESYKLLNKWKSNWESKGWNPVILDEGFSKKNPFYEKINLSNDSALFNSSIVAGPYSYMRQCYLRWLAYTNFVFENGPVVWCDYDVYNKSFTFEKFQTFTQTSELYCSSGSAGLMDRYHSNLILELFDNFPKDTNAVNSTLNSNYDLNHIMKHIDYLSDMILIQSVFWPQKIRRISTCFQDASSTPLQSFDLFHIHGGMKHPKNYDKLPFRPPRNFKSLGRDEIWDYILTIIDNN